MTDEIKEMQDDRAESPVQKHISEIIYGTHSHTQDPQISLPEMKAKHKATDFFLNKVVTKV